jgi:hypothetical protein
MAAGETLMTPSAPPMATDPGKRTWRRRVAMLGFFFFLLKGLLWVTSLAAAWLFAFR